MSFGFILGLAVLAGGQQLEGLSKEMQRLVTALQSGDAAGANSLVERVIAVRTSKLPGEPATTPITNAQLLKTTQGCEIREIRSIDFGLDDVTDTRQIVWECLATPVRPAIIAQTTLLQRGNKFEVHDFALPADLPSIRTPSVGSERGSN